VAKDRFDYTAAVGDSWKTHDRGAALNMAAALAGTPATGHRVQGRDAYHLSNFGAFATPERRVIVDINDLDETLPAPREWEQWTAMSQLLNAKPSGNAILRQFGVSHGAVVSGEI